MTFQDFLSQYDFANAIILLEGKRDVKPEDQAKLVGLGKKLAESMRFAKFRSGNAASADLYFSQGILAINPTRLEVVTPYTGHRQKENHAYNTISLDDINLANEPELVYQTKSNQKIANLIDKYVEGEKNRNTMKVAYLLRDTVKVTGTSEHPPATFAFFYDDLSNPKTGGTGHTMQICELNNGSICAIFILIYFIVQI
jgi:hypothetical protein